MLLCFRIYCFPQEKRCLFLSLDQKRHYWHKYIDGAGIQAFMNDKHVGYQARLPEEVYSVGFVLFAMKETDYNMMIMSTYGQLVVK